MTAQAVAARPLWRLPALPPAVLPRDRGLQRDELRLLVAHRSDGLLDHRRLRELPDVLRSGDILVVNTTRVIPAAVPARRDDGAQLRVHLSTPVPGGWWLVELRRADGPGTLPFADGRAGEELSLPAGGAVRLLAPHASVPGDGVRLWLAALRLPAPLHAYVDEHGGPVRYSIHGQAAD
ncbi:MAG TPA: S-adenosylmethionine:tRNA ribosyltransferase-isomerase, partial [Egibacteraceae bacterium]|nr:S-adenosylmethionine:tRNA ribosyltransferase-isomerase [Egibacteraceae bacterium]